MKSRRRRRAQTVLATAGGAGVLIPLGVWWIAATLTGVGVALPAPLEVARSTAAELTSPDFLAQVGVTTVRAVVSLLLAAVVGVPIGMATARSAVVHALVRPTVLAIRATPFISVILVAVIWFSAGTVPVFVAFLMAFPIVVDASRTAVLGVDHRLEEMARVFSWTPVRRFLHLWLPGSRHGMVGGVRSAGGIAWKVTVAAEVLSVPRSGIGSRMAEARLYLETERVLAWTIVLIVVAGVADLALRWAQERAARRNQGLAVGARRGIGGATPTRGPIPAAVAAESPRDTRAAEATGGESHATTMRREGPDATDTGGRVVAVDPVDAVGAVTLDHVSFRWNDTQPLIDEFSIRFSAEGVTAVVGPSGVGKTTLLDLCAGVITADTGEVTVEFAPSTEAPDRRRPATAMVFQEPRLLPWRTARRNVALAGREAHAAGVQRELERVGLGHIADAYPRELSGGMQQRVAVARALVHRPAILLIDEPLSGVDPRYRAELSAEIRTVVRRHRALTVISSHDIDFVLSIADRVVVLTGPPLRVVHDRRRPTGGWPAEAGDEITSWVAAARTGRVDDTPHGG